MAFGLSGYTLLYVVAACISAVAAWFVYRFRGAPGARWLFAWNVAAVAWALAEAVDYSSLTLAGHVTAGQFSYFGATTVPVFFLLFALGFSGRVRTPAPRGAAWLFLVPAISIVAAFTNRFHHLVWPGFTVLAGRPNIIVYQHGPIYWLVTVYSLVVVLAATVLIIDTARRARGVYRSQSVALVVAAVFPWVAELSYSIAPERFAGLDPALTLSVTGAILVATVSRLKLLDLVLVPREVLVEEMSDGLVVLDGTGRILEFNPAAVRMLGLARTPKFGTPAVDILAGWSREGRDAVRAVYEERRSTIASPTGAYLGIERSRLAGSTAEQVRDLFILHDITHQVEAEQALHRAYEDLRARMEEIEDLQGELREQATRDPLTGLHNRRHLAEQLERELGRAERDRYPVSLVMFDVDHFKEVNDTYGHGAGDEMLRAIAAELLEGTRRCDITCRYGGDEFVVVLPNAKAQSAQARAERWRLRMHEVMAGIGDDRVDTTISLGVATFPEHGATIDALVAAADRAVYASKAGGRDRVSVAAVPPDAGGTANGV
jgi:diguanylate cyclase (GGDEF)-like protein